MELHTAAEVISFARKLEDESAKFYRDLVERYGKDEDVLLSFARENGKTMQQIERAYYGVITDAIEACFGFDIYPNRYTFDTELPEKGSYSDALNKALQMEWKIVKFYSEGAEQSKSLLADIPRSFVIAARKRYKRITRVYALRAKSLLDRWEAKGGILGGQDN